MSEKFSRRHLLTLTGVAASAIGASALAGCVAPPPPGPPPPPPPPPPGSYSGPPPGAPPEGEEAGPPPNGPPPEGYPSEGEGPPPGYENEGPPPPPPGEGAEGYGPPAGYGRGRYGKEPKRVALYQWHPNGRQHCGACVHFIAPGHCEIVRGRISPDGWCRHFQRRG